MIGIVLVGHAPLGSGLMQCVQHVLGRPPEHVVSVDALPDEDPQALIARIADAARAVDQGEGVALLTDLFGASPSNAAVRAASEQLDVPSVLVSGSNAPMLLRALTYRHLPLSELGEKLVVGGRNGIVSTGTTAPQKQKPDIPFDPNNPHASTNHYDQQ